VTSLTHGQPTDACWEDSRDQLPITTVDALHDTAEIPDELWAQLSAAVRDVR
jgi:hypothetical protein